MFVMNCDGFSGELWFLGSFCGFLRFGSFWGFWYVLCVLCVFW